MRKRDMVLGALAFAFAMPSAAATIVDTGAPHAGSMYNIGLDENTFQSGKFTTAAATITDVQGFIGGQVAGFDVVLYSDGGSIPKAQLFRTGVTSTGFEEFQGASNLNWKVTAGSYWVAFEPIGSNTVSALFGYMSVESTPHPLSSYAYSQYGIYHNYTGYNVGVRVLGNFGVPEPASWVLMIGGFGMVGVSARRRRAAALG